MHNLWCAQSQSVPMVSILDIYHAFHACYYCELASVRHAHLRVFVHLQSTGLSLCVQNPCVGT